MDSLRTLIDELRSYGTEREWFEFKVDWIVPTELGEYISALSNSAAYAGRKNAYFVWGVNDKTHEVEGTSFDADRDLKNEPLKHFDLCGLGTSSGDQSHGISPRGMSMHSERHRSMF